MHVKAEFHYAIQLVTCSANSSRAGLRPARKLVADLVYDRLEMSREL